MAPPLQDFLLLGLRTLLILVLPVAAVVSIVGTLFSAIQAATTVQEPAAAYMVRLIAAVVTLYLCFPLFSQSFMTLIEAALR